MLAKNISYKSFLRGAIVFFALAVVVAGCTPAGPRAVLKGKKLLERGEYAEAANQLKTATTLLATNAHAWNYYGVALQGAGRPDEAAAAYKRALELDRDLVEVHFNLGNLWLEQNKPEAAKSEFTAYRLRRPNEAAVWLKQGSAQLKLGESTAAESSFSTVLSLKPNDADAYNGLGLARIQRGVPRDAVKFFAAAVQARPDFASAILNLATVNQQYLHDHKSALENYRAYLALKPRAANWDDVSTLAAALEKSEIKVAVVTPTVEKTNPPLTEPKPQPAQPAPPKPITVTTRPVVSNPPDLVVKPAPHNPPAVVRPPPTRGNVSVASTVTPQVVQVKPAPVIVTTPVAKAPTPSPVEAPVAISAMKVEAPSLRAPMPPPEKKSGFWHNLLGSSKESPATAKYNGSGLTPLPPVGDSATAPTAQAVAKPVEAAPVFSRYNYFFPQRPAAGDRLSAGGAFTKARMLEQDEKWPDALQWYQQAAALDPAWFEAQYNTGVVAHKLRNFALALPRYETALAIQPDSADARYNFSIALKAAGYPVDAAEELKKILAANPGEVRAHLALANLYAQSLRDTPRARTHYQKVLELEPTSPQTQDIRLWLSTNP